MNKHIKLLAVLSIVVVFGVSFFVADNVSAQTNEQIIQQLQTQIEQLKAQMAILQSQLGIVSPSKPEPVPIPKPVPVPSVCPVFSHTLYHGVSDAATGGEVTKLQKMLAEDPAVYPEGLVTGYYGSLTEKAVQRLQAKHGVVSSGDAATTGYGVVGPQTRAKISVACATSVPIPVPRDNITVLSPNGGEQWALKSNQLIQWISGPIVVGSALAKIAYVDIDLMSWSFPCKKGETCPLSLAPSFSTALARKIPNSGSFSWTVGKNISGSTIPTGPYVIRISNSENTSQYDQSDAAFNIIKESVNKQRCVPLSTSPASVQVNIVTDNTKERQTMEGFGATHQALVYGGSLGDTLTPSQRSRALDAIFNQVKITTGQIPTIFEAPANSNLSTFFENQANDNNDPLKLDWNGFSTILGNTFKQKVVDVVGSNFNLYPDVRVSLVRNSKWLSHIQSADYNIFLDEVAEQVLAGITYWKNTYGVEPTYAMLFNEPLSGNAELGSHASVQTVVDIVKRSGARLRHAGFNKVKFVVPSDETEFISLDTAKAVLTDPEARQYVGAIGYHPYPYLSTYSWPPNILNTSGKGQPDQERVLVRNRLRDLAKQYGVKLFMTEVSSGPAGQSKPINPLSYDVFRARAIHIHDEFTYADASAFFGMNSMWDAKSQKDHFRGRGFEDDILADEGDIIRIDNAADKIYITGMGRAIGHYARFVNKGAVRIETTSSDPLVQVTAFRDDAKKQMTWVVINNNPAKKTVRIEVKGLSLAGDLTGEQSTKTSYWQKFDAFIPDTASNFTITLPSESVTTIVGHLKSSPTSNVFGIGILPFEDLIDPRVLAALEELNVKWIRVGFPWVDTETEEGKFRFGEDGGYPYFDKIVSEMQKKNINAEVILGNAPPLPWPNSQKGWDIFADRASRYARKVVERYRPGGILAQKNSWTNYGIRYWEIFNEPNLPGYGWLEESMRPEEFVDEYVKVLVAMNNAIRTADPKAIIILGGLSPDGMPPESFLRTVYKLGGKNCFDIIAFHPYGRIDQFGASVLRLKQIAGEFGDAKPVWFNEFGTDDEGTQRQLLEKAMAQRNEADAFFWFSLRDLQPDSEKYGLLRYDFIKKPIFTVLKELLRQ